MKAFQFALLTMTLLFLFSCKERKSENINDIGNAAEFLSSYTRGVITDKQDIVFVFRGDIKVDSSKISTAIDIEPDVKYVTSFSSFNNSIKITPERLERDQDYKVSLDLKKLLGKDRIIVSNLKVQGQYVNVRKKGLGIDNQNNKALELAITTAFEEDIEDLKRMFSVPKENIQITKTSDTHYLAKIQYSGKGDVNIKWDASDLKSKNSGVISYAASDLNKFKVLSTYHDRQDNTLTVYFSQNIKRKQDLTGLIKAGNNNASYTINGNKIIVQIKSQNTQYANIYIKKGIQSVQGTKTNNDYQYGINLELVKPQVSWLDEGSYVPVSGKFLIPFKAKGLKAVKIAIAEIPKERAAQFIAWNDMVSNDDYELMRYGDFLIEKDIDLSQYASDLEHWNEFGIDMSKSFKRKPGYIYRIYLSFNPSQTVLNCNDDALLDYEVKTLDKNWFDKNYRYYNYYSDYNYNDRDNPCKASFYSVLSALEKNVHCTNVFPIIKQGKDNVVVAVKELESNNLASGAKVTLLNLQGKDIRSLSTSDGGVVSFKNLKREAKAVRIEYNNYTTYFSMKSGDENSLTEFDISSNVRSASNELFVYSERDVRRPGDTIFLNVMINSTDFDYPEDLPVTLKVYNPKNIKVAGQKQAIKKNKWIYSFAVPTSLEAPTGYWKALINVGPTEIRHNIRIETIKPNVIDAIYAIDGQEKGWIYNDRFTGSLDVQYLAGYPMKNGNVKTNTSMYSISEPFEAYNGYRFSKYDISPMKDVKLFEGKTDAQGKIRINSDVKFSDINAVSRIILDTKVDLPGGGNNALSSSFLVSPFSSYTGIEEVKGRGWRGSFQYGETPKIRLIHVDNKGKPTAGKVKIQLFKAKEDWWYDRYRLSQNYSVRTSSYYELQDEYTENFGNRGKATYTHKKDYGSGMFVLVAEDLVSGHISEYKFHSVVTDDYKVKANPIFIQLELEKDNYDIGETMNMKLPNIKNAQALVSVEKGEKIIETFWMDLKNPRLELKIKENYYPNFYLNISVVQKYGNTENDRPMRMYTVEKIKVNERNQILLPEIKAPKKVEPNESFTVQVHEKKGQAMEYTLAVVDVGLLNITGFRTPDPIQHFSKQFPLLVKTWDIFADLIYYLDPSYSGVFSIGGDGMNKKMDEAAGFNRFEPVVYHLGPFQLGKNKTNKHKITLPNYIGNLKVMVVAANDKTFGNAEKRIKVASPLMIQSQLPRALNISDEIALPISVFKDEKSIKDVSIKASNDNNALSFVSRDIGLNLGDERQGLGELKFKVNEMAGKTTIDLQAQSGRYTSSEETTLFVNYPNSYEDKTTYLEIPKGGTETIDINTFGYAKTKNVNLAISGLILPDFAKYYSELIDYPHGCLEQITSRGLCLLYTDKMIELSPEDKKQTEQHLEDAVQKIYRLQKSDGSFRYWEGGYYHPWSDLYAGNFLLEAVEHGKDINQSVINNWIKNTSKTAASWNVSGLSSSRLATEEIIQAYRLYLLAKANAPEKSAMNRFRQRELTSLAQILLGGAYYYSAMQDIGERLLDDGISSYNRSGYSYATFGSDIRDRAIILSILSTIRKGKPVDRYYKDFVKDLNNEDWISTQEKGWALMACRAYFKDKNAKENQMITFDLKSNIHNKAGTLKNNGYANYYWNANQMGDNATVRNTGENSLYVIKNERAIPSDLYPTPQSNSLGMKVRYTDLSNNPIDLNDMTQGQEIKIIVSVANDDIIQHQSLAMSLKMPSGWELQNPRLLNTVQLKSDPYDYQDYRDDRVYTYFALNKKQEKTFRFRAIANLKGDFYMPAIKVEHMYLGSVNATTEARRVNVRR